ncbi:MAG TPA: hypothetical protein VGO80_07180 [Solirubrobacteraceae bacterium]|jgi:hypothetical protein|nr:hypothetical protein [Solirubrobacteraceae bacterium]
MSAADEAITREAVEARIVEYHDVRFADALDAISYLRDPGDSVIAGGSLTLGLGNGLSDLDLVVSGEASAESSRVPLQHWVKTLRVDVWKLRHDAMEELVQRAERVLEGEAPVDGAFGDIFEEADLKLLHRVAFGIAVDGAPLRPAATRSYRDIAGDLLVREYAERMRESAFVAQAAIAADDPIGAAFNARLAVQSALHATLCAHRRPFTGDKWLRERLNMDAPKLAELHESFVVLPDDDAAEFVERALEACERLSGRDLSLAALALQVRFEAGDLELYTAASERYLLSVARDGIWELDDAEAQTWTRLDRQPGWACEPSDRAALKLSFELYALGVASLRWQQGIPLAELAFGEVAIE